MTVTTSNQDKSQLMKWSHPLNYNQAKNEQKKGYLNFRNSVWLFNLARYSDCKPSKLLFASGFETTILWGVFYLGIIVMLCLPGLSHWAWGEHLRLKSSDYKGLILQIAAVIAVLYCDAHSGLILVVSLRPKGIFFWVVTGVFAEWTQWIVDNIRGKCIIMLLHN